MRNFDAVIIGAGNGGLTAAATLARNGRKVLLLEKHNIPGGCATSFCRGRFEFEVALHQLSGMGTTEKPGPLRMLLNELGVLEKLDFIPMTDLFRVVVPGKLDITLKPDREKTIRVLQDRFPNEKEGITAWFDLIYKLFTEVITAFVFKDPEVTREKYPLYFKHALQNTGELMDQYFTDPLLKTAVSPYWTYMGLPPGSLSMVDMAALYFGYLEFLPFHLKGGSQALSNALADAIIKDGGEIRFNCGAARILVENGRVNGVLTETGETISTDYVISNASKVSTYTELVDEQHVPDLIEAELRQTSISQSAFTLYMGLDCPPETAGITESTNFIIGNLDPDHVYERMKIREINENDGLLLTCYNLIDPGFSPEGTSQVAVVTLKYGDAWFKVPPAEYASEKYRIADNMLSVVEKAFPDIRSHIEEIEIATPLTHMRYLGTPGGAIYGFDHHVKDSNLFVPNKAHINGLYGAGGWYGYNGFQATLASGVSAARAVLGKMAASQGGR